MIKLQLNDINGLKNLGSGKFGTVLKKDDHNAYKIYHPTVSEDLTGIAIDNPALMLPRYRFYSLIRRSRKLEHSGGVLDIVLVDGKFEGVCIPYVEGDKLIEVVDNIPFRERVVLSRQIVRNAKELNRHLIYPTDYKLDNIILSHNKAELIDLDDCRTHVYYIPSVICRSIGINTLAEKIQEIFNQFSHFEVKHDIGLTRNKSFRAYRYKKIEQYIDDKEIERNILFITKDADLNEVKRLIQEYSFDAVYVGDTTDEKEKIEHDAERLINSQISLFDLTKDELVKDYHTIENVKEAYKLEKGKSLVKTYKRDS